MGASARPQELKTGESPSRRYGAFISYSHQDAAFAQVLHRRIETYRLPSHAAARADPSRLVGHRLRPLFRDVDELTAAHDLTEAVKAALKDSEFLVVVCSPAAAASPWVAKEIEVFLQTRPHAHILAALAEGEPKDAFPQALTAGGAEPLAADFRGDGAARRLAMLKLVASLAGTPLDELVQRDAQRRLRMTLTGVAAAAGIAAVVAALSVATWMANVTADAERARSGKLGDFVSTDLRTSLEAAGRHDLLAQVDRAALNAYRAGGADHLTAEQLEQEAKLLQGAGKDAEKKGDLKGARADFETALKITAALIAQKPDDPKRIFAHAQSEYWIGFIDWRQGDGVGARAGFEAYARLADRLMQLDPANDDWRMEKVYAANNLGILALRQAGNPVAAEPFFRGSLAELDTIGKHKPADAAVLNDKATAYAWLADSQRLQGHLREALASRDAQRATIQARLAEEPNNLELERRLLSYELGAARIVAQQGAADRAIELLEAGRRHATSLRARDPDNADLAKQARMFELFKVRVWLDRPGNRRPNREIERLLNQCEPLGPGGVNQEIDAFCNVLLARFLAERGNDLASAKVLRTVEQRTAQMHDQLTANWGLDLRQEARLVRAVAGGENK